MRAKYDVNHGSEPPLNYYRIDQSARFSGQRLILTIRSSKGVFFIIWLELWLNQVCPKRDREQHPWFASVTAHGPCPSAKHVPRYYTPRPTMVPLSRNGATSLLSVSTLISCAEPVLPASAPGEPVGGGGDQGGAPFEQPRVPRRYERHEEGGHSVVGVSSFCRVS